MSKQKHSKEIANDLAARVEDGKPITTAEYRRLMLTAQAAMLRELDSIAYRAGVVEKEYMRTAKMFGGGDR